MNNLISENVDIFKNIYDFQSQNEMKTLLINATQKVKKLAVPMLTDYLAAEILTRGIFNYAMNQNTNADKLKKMNLLLNEFGLNIRFDAAKVTRAPDMSIVNAQQQAKIDRDAFEKDKKTPLAKMQEEQFKKHLKSLGISHPDEESMHHFLALKYNPFIEKDLNQSSNYVKTARQHPWNLDGHALVHVFDTSGEFLLSDENHNFRFMDFNMLRKAFNSGKNLTLQIPILQVKNKNNEFCDLLSLSQKQGECGMCVSTDKTPTTFMHLPAYCKENLKIQHNQQTSFYGKAKQVAYAR